MKLNEIVLRKLATNCRYLKYADFILQTWQQGTTVWFVWLFSVFAIICQIVLVGDLGLCVRRISDVCVFFCVTICARVTDFWRRFWSRLWLWFSGGRFHRPEMHGQYHERRADDDSADVSRVVSGDFFFVWKRTFIFWSQMAAFWSMTRAVATIDEGQKEV